MVRLRRERSSLTPREWRPAGDLFLVSPRRSMEDLEARLRRLKGVPDPVSDAEVEARLQALGGSAPDGAKLPLAGDGADQARQALADPGFAATDSKMSRLISACEGAGGSAGYAVGAGGAL